MKPLITILCVLCALVSLWLIPGCDKVNSVSPDQLKAVAAEVNDLVVKVDVYQKTATAAIEQLVAANAIDPNKAAALLAANEDVDKLQAAVKAISNALQSADYTDNTTGLLTLIEAAQAANAATAPWNPYSALIAASLTILSTVLVVVVRKKSAEASALGAKYQAHKQGVERTMKEVSVASDDQVKAVEAQLYNNIGQARAALGVT